MSPNQPIPLLQRPKFSEGTALSSKRDYRNNSFLWKKGELNTWQIDSFGLALQKLSREVAKMRRRIVGGNGQGGGWHWQVPFELDPTVDVPGPDGNGTMTAVYISKLNPLAVVGMTDIVSNATVVSCQGIWLANQAVPATAASKYNVPVFPYPAGAAVLGGGTFLMGTTAPSGTPLIGDLDLIDPATGLPIRFWTYLGDVT